MGAKKPNFLQNLWNKSKTAIKGVVTVAGNAAGTFIGIPNAGTMAAGLLDKIPVSKMAAKALEQGEVKSEKVAETLVQNNIAATPQNIKAATAAVAAEATQQAALIGQAAPTVNTSALSFKDKAFAFIRKYWYAVAGGILVLVLIFFKPNRKGYKRRR